MMTIQLPKNSPLNKDLIAWSDVENYTKLLRRRIIFLQEGNEFASYVEYINEDGTRNMVRHRNYDTCITVAYYLFRKRFCGTFSSDLDKAADFTVDNETLATIEKGPASIEYANDQYSRNKLANTL
jgi:hypothetical protein